MSPYVVPDHVLERNLPTSLTPTFWGTLTLVSFDSLDADSPQSSVIPENHLVTQLSTSPKGSENAITPLSKPVDFPAIPHPYLYFDDGSITFRAQGILYRLHRSLLCRGSKKFEDLLSELSAQQESSTSPPTIPLDDVKAVDFDAFLSILYPQNYNSLERRTFEQWSAILDLSTRWGFTSIRDLAIRCIRPPDHLKKLLLARKNNIDMWIQPALLELCRRPQPLSLEEARLMDFEDVILVGSVRQTARSSTLTVDGTGIMNCIQAWQSREPWSSVPVPLDEPATADTQPTAADESDIWARAATNRKKKKGKKCSYICV
ncbi:hypothetical protein F5888DRAFT_1657393 [Russula emetica]|nr:hypothetical protein F5888DRAFT_1657393 [Russula emetica]